MSETQIYLELSENLQNILTTNNISLRQLFLSAELDVEVTYQVAPYHNNSGGQTRDLKTVILTSSILIPSIGFTLSKLMNTYYHRPIHITYEQIEEIRDADGTVLRDRDGNLQMKTVVNHEILHTQRDSEESFEAKLDKFVMRFKSSEN